VATAGTGRDCDSGLRLGGMSATIASQVSRPLRNCSSLLAREQLESCDPSGIWRAVNMLLSSAELVYGWIVLSWLASRVARCRSSCTEELTGLNKKCSLLRSKSFFLNNKVQKRAGRGSAVRAGKLGQNR